MDDFILTSEEMNAIKLYKNYNSKQINQILNSDPESDIDMILKGDDTISYRPNEIEKTIKIIKDIYTAMLKSTYARKNNDCWSFVMGTSSEQVLKFKSNINIDQFLEASLEEENAKMQYAFQNDKPAIIYLRGSNKIPYLYINDVVKSKIDESNVLIAPFTRVKKIKEYGAKQIGVDRQLHSYSLFLEKQGNQDLSDYEMQLLYRSILEEAESTNEKIQKSVSITNIIHQNFEVMQKVSADIEKYKNEMKRKEEMNDYPESAKKADLADVEELKAKYDELSEENTILFQDKKQYILDITKFKKAITIYCMAMCNDIEYEFKNKYGDLSAEIDSSLQELEEQEETEEINEKLKIEQIIEEKSQEINIETAIQNSRNEMVDSLREDAKRALVLVQQIQQKIERLILNQQQYTQIAQKFEVSYRAVNNAFSMRDKAEVLISKVEGMVNDVENICYMAEKYSDKELKDLADDMYNVAEDIAEFLESRSKEEIDRFDEMMIIEENELKRAIKFKIIQICAAAELKKLDDEEYELEEISGFKRFVGKFTGRNKLDEIRKMQIKVEEKQIKRTISTHLEIDVKYSIHEMLAYIDMFCLDNEEDELVEDDIEKLMEVRKLITKTFSVSEDRVNEILEQKRKNYLPVEAKKISKEERMKIETYRFLNKNEYDRIQTDKRQLQYIDTTPDDMNRLIRSINEKI